jgi:2-C-methyl-D-erythritol 4-phosphate cytidylyltransferase
VVEDRGDPAKALAGLERLEAPEDLVLVGAEALCGRGERLGDERPKAFARLGGRVLLAEPLERLERSDWIDQIVIAAPPEWEEPSILVAEEIAATKVSSAVTGGASRSESVRLALADVPGDADVVLVHDAARPLLPEAVIERVLAPLGEGWDGVVPGLQLADTVKRVEGERVTETLRRDDLLAVQTPQAFLADVLRRAVAGDVSAATDCSSLVEADGGRVRWVEGDSKLLKVTDADDLALVESWLAEP